LAVGGLILSTFSPPCRVEQEVQGHTLLAFVLALAAAPALAGFPPTRYVDLDQPGALERVRHDNPAHFAAITHILREAPELKPQVLPGWMRASFDANIQSVLAIKLSYPPQTRLDFTLGTTRYVAIVTLRNTEPYLSPAR